MLINKEMLPFVESGIPPGCVGKVCGSVVWAFPIQRDSKGQPTQSGSRLYPSHDIQLETVSKTASKAETIEEEDNKKTGREQRLCESESVRERKCDVDRDAESVCRCDHPGVQNRLTPTLTFLCII